MSDRFSIEVRRRTVGIAVRSVGGFRFFASAHRFFALDGKLYPSVKAIIADANALAGAQDGGPGDLSTVGVKRTPEPTIAKSYFTPRRRRPIPAAAGHEEPPKWFRWAVCFGIATGPAMLATVAAALAG